MFVLPFISRGGREIHRGAAHSCHPPGRTLGEISLILLSQKQRMGDSTTVDGRRDSLQDEFFENFTRKQRILLDVDGEYIRGVDIRE